MQIKSGIIFDMDGTMVDNMTVHHRAWQAILAELGLELSMEEVRQSIHGINEEIIERLFGERFTLTERKQIAWEKEARYRSVFLQELKLIAGLDVFLQQAYEARIPMAIATAAPRENVDFVLDNLQIRHYFQAVIDASQVSKGKPEPEVFAKAAEAMGLLPTNCLVFEDSPTGAEASRRAGCPVFIITTTHTPAEFAHFPNLVRAISDFTPISPAEALAAAFAQRLSDS